MKKKIALLLGLVLTASALAAGCSNVSYEDETTGKDAAGQGQKNEADTDKAEEGGVDGEAEATSDGSEWAEGSVKTGLAIQTSVGNSAEPGEKAGLAQTDISLAAVTVDAEGRIVKCVIDGVQTKVEFGADGKLVTDAATEFKSKNELGADYGMVAYGNATAEWNEQAAAFAAYCEGKTVDEITDMAVTEDGKAADADLAATCTIHVGEFQTIVAKAVENAADMGAQADDKLGLGVITNIAKSMDAAADAEGLAQAYTTAVATTVNAEGVITSATINAVQANVNFDTTGKIITDLTAAVPSKNELGDAYGMKAASSIGKEWNQQAAAYAAYAVGKTLEEVNGTAVEAGVPTDADLAASVTIHITDFNTIITKAVDSAE